MTAQQLDPVTLSVLKGRLEQIADEMDATLFRAAFNPIIAEAHDASHGLYHKETGETLAQGKSGLPIFVGVMAFAVRLVIETAKARGEGFSPDDVYIFNDSYEGGTHFSDFKLVRPYFRDGELFCFLASVGHWRDVGGATPGNYNPSATERLQEAVQIPPVKIVRDGVLQHDIVEILKANSRLPVSLYGDLHGQLGALELGVKRLDALLDAYGDETVSEAMTALRRRGEMMMRAELSALPDGSVSCLDYLDNDGIDDAPLPIALELTVSGDALTLDFSRSADACRGPVNISRSTAEAAVYVALKHYFPQVPANAGVMAPVKVVIAKGSILDATAPRPVGGYTETILRLIDVVHQALAQIAPERANGCAYGTINALSIAGRRSTGPDAGQPWVMFSFFGGGHGGHPRGDGLNHGNAPISMATIPPLEILEAAYPIRFTQWALRDDSGGAGRHRGGLGAVYEIELLEEHADVFLFGERGKHPPAGVVGGDGGARNRFFFPDPRTGAPASPPMVSKMTGVQLKKGQRVRLETPGGGGFGRAEERAPAAVARDAALGFVSRETAREAYRVVLGEDFTVDEGATRRLREGAAS